MDPPLRLLNRQIREPLVIDLLDMESIVKVEVGVTPGFLMGTDAMDIFTAQETQEEEKQVWEGKGLDLTY